MDKPLGMHKVDLGKGGRFGLHSCFSYCLSAGLTYSLPVFLESRLSWCLRLALQMSSPLDLPVDDLNWETPC